MRLSKIAMTALPLLLAAPVYFAFQGPQRIPDYYKSEAEAKPFHTTLDPALFKDPAVRKAYQAAREIPGVLAQQPCYCYCDQHEHGGGPKHKGLLACHRDGHSAG
jgi:hypothetical protein